MNRSLTMGLYGAGTAFAWLTLGRLVASGEIAQRGVLSTEGVLTCLLAVVAPGATFVPLARWARAPLYDVEALLGWGVLALTLVFVKPSSPPTLAQFLLFLLPLTVALATAAALLSYLAGLRVYRDDARRHDFVRARRQGYLAAFACIALGLLHSVGTLSPATGTLLVAVAVLVEMFALSRARYGSFRPQRSYENTRSG